jgi:hypothetical protein
MDPDFQLADNDATEQLLELLLSELSRRCTLRPQAGIRARRLWDLSFDIEIIADFLQAARPPWVWPHWDVWLAWRLEWLVAGIAWGW